jgi:predicted nucleotidyltransferase
MHLDNSYISRIRQYFITQPVLKAYLFGSYSRGEAEQNSDIDILVELDYSKPIGMEFITMQLDLEDILNKKVDLLSEKAVSKYVKPFIEKEKVLIYER